jgi:LDH2 family malate/lactate/ureidoglycolate dehydrogenase
VAGVLATDVSIELAREHGAGVVFVRHSAHYGAAAFYAMRAARAGMVAVSMTNSEPFVAAYGTAEPALGTNPIAFAAPGADGVFNLDMATSQVAVNRIFNARDEGRPIPEGWGQDARGRPTTDPGAVLAAVPLGGYKGYGLAVMVEVLCGVLAGAGIRHEVGLTDVGHLHAAFDPERTVGRERFAAVLGGLLRDLRALPPADGFDEVLVPGDPEDRARAERERSGVPIEPALWAALRALGDELGVPL